MVQTSMRQKRVLVEDAGGLVGMATRLASAGHGNDEHQKKQLQEASALLSAFRSLGAVGNGTDKNGTNNKTHHLQDMDKDQLASIKDVINKTFFANLHNLNTEDQAEINSDHQLLMGCKTQL